MSLPCSQSSLSSSSNEDEATVSTEFIKEEGGEEGHTAREEFAEKEEDRLEAGTSGDVG